MSFTRESAPSRSRRPSPSKGRAWSAVPSGSATSAGHGRTRAELAHDLQRATIHHESILGGNTPVTHTSVGCLVKTIREPRVQP